MIDTMGLQVLLNERQFDTLFTLAVTKDREQWALWHPGRGELWIRYVRDLVETDQPSYRRELMWSIPQSYVKDSTYLTIELSLPKYWYGHNVHLLYDWYSALVHLRTFLQQQLGLGRSRLPPVEQWLIRRLDLCYAWRLPTQETADALISALTRLKYPHKKPRHYPGSAYWPGTTYTFKIYAKHPEFRTNDMKKLLKAGATHEWINDVESKAEGVIRAELTARSKWLKRNGIQTVGDLLGEVNYFHVPTPQLWQWAQSIKNYPIHVVIGHVAVVAATEGYAPTLLNDLRFSCDEPISFPELRSPPLDEGGPDLVIPAGTIIPSVMDKPAFLLGKQLTKLVGNGDMSMKDKIREKLEQHYSSTKAARLMGFWLLVQSFGSDEAKDIYTKPTYYRYVSDLKAAGVMLLEQTDKIVKVDPGFFNTFKLEIPSDRVTNKWDDFREGDNLLNLAEWQDKRKA